MATVPSPRPLNAVSGQVASPRLVIRAPVQQETTVASAERPATQAPAASLAAVQTVQRAETRVLGAA